jgi:CheY-like chemotaxis protein
MSVFGFDILLIEDNPADVALVKKILTYPPIGLSAKYRATVASSYQEGVRKVAALTADLVLLDLTLPDSSGLETLTHFLGAVRGRLPVIVLTGTEDVLQALEAIKFGASQYIVKDWLVSTPELLHFMMAGALEQHRLVRELVIFQRERLKEFQPLLSACSHCGQWKDKATNTWHTPEEYMRVVAEIEITHGICDQCAGEMYKKVLDD